MIYFCRPCREPVDTAECPFCDHQATPFDEICDLASVDTRPKGGDAKQAPFTSGAVPKADAQPSSGDTSNE